MSTNSYPVIGDTLINVAKEVKCVDEVFCNKSVKCQNLVVFDSSIIVKRVVVTDNYTVTATGDDYIVMVDTTSSAITVTLPTVDSENSLTVGRVIHVIDVGGNANQNNITITSSSDISGESSVVISQNYNSISIVSSTSAWFMY